MIRSILVGAVWLVSQASASAAGNPGLGPDGKTSEPVRVEENSVLPDAGKAGSSAAPTMALDCTKTPDQCTGRPINAPGATTGSVSPGLPQQSK